MEKIQETKEIKQTKRLFNYKQQQQALIKQKEKENVLTDLELLNLKSVFLFNFEEIKRTTPKPKI